MRKKLLHSGCCVSLTLRFDVGYYAYIETSSPRRRNDNAKIRNGPFSGVKCLHFYYSMIGNTIGSLIIHQHIHGQDLNIWSKSGEQPGSEWHYDNVTLHGNNYYVSTVFGI